jgi:hypothetical protein
MNICTRLFRQWKKRVHARRAEFISPAENSVQTGCVEQAIFYKFRTRGPGANSAVERNLISTTLSPHPQSTFHILLLRQRDEICLQPGEVCVKFSGFSQETKE